MISRAALSLVDSDPARCEFHGDVKAIIYNEMKIMRCGGPWTIRVVVDM
jgi:SHS2 domain-containing protein